MISFFRIITFNLFDELVMLNPFNPIRPYTASIEPLPINVTIFLRSFDDYI